MQFFNREDIDMDKIIKSWWYKTCDGKCICIVKFKATEGGIKYRIGVVDSLDQKQLDELFIMEYGDKFIPNQIF